MNFSFYIVDSQYCEYLRTADKCVPYTQDKKSNRPFVGIVFEIDGFSYFAPLTSPKKKHMKMKNQLDFLKINGGVWGAVNFNNMIPVAEEHIHKVEMNPTPLDTDEEKVYKSLMRNQLSWCNSNKETILRQAENLYHVITNGTAWETLKNRCCDFRKDEELCRKYNYWLDDKTDK